MSILSVEDFCEKHNVSKNTIYSQRSQGRAEYTFEKNGVVYIDESKIVELRKKREVYGWCRIRIFIILHTFFVLVECS